MPVPLGIIFDYGNTLLTEDYFDLLAGTRRMLELTVGEVNVSAEDLLKGHIQLNQELNLTREETLREFTFIDLQRVLYTGQGLTFRAAPVEMAREFWRAARRFQPAPGIHALLEYLSSRGIKTGILSNCPFSAEIMNEDLVGHGLAHHFSFFISSADHGWRKPHPGVFKTAIQKMDLAPRDIWFAGDSLEYDVKGAINSGLLAVWYNRLNQPNEGRFPCLEVKSWSEFMRIIDG